MTTRLDGLRRFFNEAVAEWQRLEEICAPPDEIKHAEAWCQAISAQLRREEEAAAAGQVESIG